MDAAQAIASGRPTRHDTLLTSAQLWKNGYTHGALEKLYAFSCPDPGKAAEKAVSGWSNSASHLQAMLSPQNDSLGIGVYVYGTTYYCILLMGCADSHNSLENMAGPGFDGLTMEQRADRILSGGQP